MDGDEWRSATTGMRFRRVPGGTFTMGSPPEERGRGVDEVQHDVTLTHDCWVAECQVTQRIYREVTGADPAANDQRLVGGQPGGPCASFQDVSLVNDDYPAICVSWFDATVFANALSTQDGLRPAYAVRDGLLRWDTGADGYRLLTEAEWERAAQGGARHVVFSGTDSYSDVCLYGNVGDQSAVDHFGWGDVFQRSGWTWSVQCRDRHTGLATVGSYQPNAFGLFDFTGNVIEWVWDFYGPYETQKVVDPVGPELSVNRVGRGGGWMNPPVFARIGHRGQALPSRKDFDLGFRLCRTLGA
jgi:formylglycine-generating enzyme required for sulfatase activity